MRIAITGGTGSLGSALIARLAKEGAERIVTFSRDEQKRLALQAAYVWHPGVKVYAGDVRDRARMEDIFSGCEVVIHAAARKVVSGHHDEPMEMHRTNVEGTLNVIAAARSAGVRRLLFVSSDKAVKAENVYGMSKALAERLVISENARSWARGLRLAVIRYGNVIGSNGSVVKLWRQCLADGKPLPLSDTRMTRFWLTIDQAAGYVLRAVGDMRGGDVLVPLLKSAKLSALLEAVAAPRTLVTRDVFRDPQQEYCLAPIGIRAGGEKLHEELLSEDELRRAVVRNGFVVVPPPQTTDAWETAPWLGDPVGADFEYRSDTWPDIWSSDALRELLSTGQPA